MIDFAYAQSAAAPAGFMGQLGSFLPLLAILVVFYFLVMRPQQKKYKLHQAMINELKKGDKVVTNSGIAGRITKVGEQFFTVEIAPNVAVEIERNSISTRVEG
jgi:preprotein translocase subunit YajC